MIYNVSQLLKAAIGATLTVALDDDDRLDLADTDVRLAGPITGTIRLHRTNQGIYAQGTMLAPVRLECSRCLEAFTTTLSIPLAEEFYPTVDVNTGLPVPPPTNTDLSFPINRHHELDMHEAIRQNLLLALPARALCREDCAGLCPQCGKNLNEGPCACQPEEEDTRLAVLRQLLDGHEPADLP
jgi:uncharacterized protein